MSAKQGKSADSYLTAPISSYKICTGRVQTYVVVSNDEGLLFSHTAGALKSIWSEYSIASPVATG